MSNDETAMTVSAFGADLLQGLGDMDEDSPLHEIDTTAPDVKFLPKFTVNRDKFTIRAKDGDIVREGRDRAMVIHWAHPYTQRVFYKTGFDPKNPTAPDCGSNGAAKGQVERPDPTVATPMAERCDTCEYNKNGCKKKQTIIVSEKITEGTAQLMKMTCNATTVFNTDGENEGKLGLAALLREIARIGKNMHQFVLNFHIWPDGNCMVKFSPLDAIPNPEDPNLVAHEKVKKALDFAEICAMDFTPWESEDEESVVENPAPAATVKEETASAPVDAKAQEETDSVLDSASDAVEDFLKSVE